MATDDFRGFFDRAKLKFAENLEKYPEIEDSVRPLFEESLEQVDMYLRLENFIIANKSLSAVKAIWERFLYNIDNEKRRARELEYLEYCCNYARFEAEKYAEKEEDHKKIFEWMLKTL